MSKETSDIKKSLENSSRKLSDSDEAVDITQYSSAAAAAKGKKKGATKYQEIYQKTSSLIHSIHNYNGDGTSYKSYLSSETATSMTRKRYPSNTALSAAIRKQNFGIIQELVAAGAVITDYDLNNLLKENSPSMFVNLKCIWSNEVFEKKIQAFIDIFMFFCKKLKEKNELKLSSLLKIIIEGNTGEGSLAEYYKVINDGIEKFFLPQNLPIDIDELINGLHYPGWRGCFKTLFERFCEGPDAKQKTPKFIQDISRLLAEFICNLGISDNEPFILEMCDKFLALGADPNFLAVDYHLIFEQSGTPIAIVKASQE